MNVRAKDRVAVNLACTFKNVDRSLTGRVRNMSRIGLLTVLTGTAAENPGIQIGETWQVEIELPVLHSFVPNAFYCQAVVVRVQLNKRKDPEVAFRIDRMVAADLRSKTATFAASTSQMVI
jgi:hypothetical protein